MVLRAILLHITIVEIKISISLIFYSLLVIQTIVWMKWIEIFHWKCDFTPDLIKYKILLKIITVVVNKMKGLIN